MSGPTVTVPIFAKRQGKRGAKDVLVGVAPTPIPQGRVPRVARLMALAILCEERLAAGDLSSRKELARVGQVTVARVSQILNLLNLAPDLQETLLNLPRVESGRDPIKLADLQPIASTLDWQDQRRMWQAKIAPREERAAMANLKKMYPTDIATVEGGG